MEDAVAGAGAGFDGYGGTFGEAEGFGIDVVDADEVGAEVGDDEVFAGWVDEDLMRVGRRLSFSYRARLRQGVVDGFEWCERSGGGVDGVRGEGVGVVSDCQQLGAIDAGIDGRVDRSDRDDGVLNKFERSGVVVADLEGGDGAVGASEVFVEAEEITLLEVD